MSITKLIKSGVNMLRKVLLLSLLVLVFCLQGVFAQKEEPNCGIYAWVIDKDPNGLNVRDKPNVNGKVIAKLKTDGTPEDEVVVYIVGYSNGWVKIGLAENGKGQIFNDLGWVSAKMVETGTKGSPNYNSSVTIYAAAKTSSKKVGTIPSEDTVKIAGYQCGWVKVTYKGKTGWIRENNICGSPFTTCS